MPGRGSLSPAFSLAMQSPSYVMSDNRYYVKTRRIAPFPLETLLAAAPTVELTKNDDHRSIWIFDYIQSASDNSTLPSTSLK